MYKDNLKVFRWQKVRKIPYVHGKVDGLHIK